MNYFVKWQKWAEIYVILYMLSLFQNNKSYPVIRMSYYAIKYFNNFFTGGRELESHFIKGFRGNQMAIRLHGKSQKLSLPFRSQESFSIPAWCRNESYKFKPYDDTRSFLYGFL